MCNCGKLTKSPNILSRARESYQRLQIQWSINARVYSRWPQQFLQVDQGHHIIPGGENCPWECCVRPTPWPRSIPDVGQAPLTDPIRNTIRLQGEWLHDFMKSHDATQTHKPLYSDGLYMTCKTKSTGSGGQLPNKQSCYYFIVCLIRCASGACLGSRVVYRMLRCHRETGHPSIAAG